MIHQGHKKRNKRPRGVVLLLALIVIAALTAAGIGASTIVINEFRTLASTDQGIRAFYAADIGIERSLYTLFNNRLIGTSFAMSGSSPTEQIQFNSPAWNGDNPPPQNKTTVTTDKSTLTSTTKTFSIAKSQIKQLDLTQNDRFWTIDPARSLYFSSDLIQTNDTDPERDEPWLEISYVYFLTKSDTVGAPDVAPPNATVRVVSKKNLRDGVKIILYNGMTTSWTPSPIVPVNPVEAPELPDGKTKNDISGYIVRFRALQEAITGLTAYACIDDGPCDSDQSKLFKMGGEMNIVSRGSTDQASFILSATVPIRPPASGVFDYVLFSEQALDKN